MNNTRWLRAIKQILLVANRPLTADNIAAKAVGDQLVVTFCRWPEISVYNTIRTHIRNGNSLSIETTVEGRDRVYAISESMRHGSKGE